MLVSYTKELTVSNKHKGDRLKFVQSYGNLRVAVSDCISSAGFLERLSATADRIVSDSLLWWI